MSKFLFNFKPQFQEAVASGVKRQTIRQNRVDGKRPKPGDVACLYTGLRTAKAKLLREAPVVRCRAVRMDFEDDILVIDGQRASWDERGELVLADGFPHWAAMRQFFLNQYGLRTFEGFCVEWSA